MDIKRSIVTTPWWYFLVLYLVVFFSGQFLAPPITAYVYGFKSEDELDLLFGLMAIVGFPLLSVLLLLATYGLKLVRRRFSKKITVVYIVVGLMLAPLVYYMLCLINYYGFPSI